MIRNNMENKEQLKLSDLQKEDAIVPKQSIRDYYESPDTFNAIRNNTTIEDAVTAQPDALGDQSIAEQIQMLTDKTNQYDLINTRLTNLDEDIATEFQGRGITNIGRRAEILTRGRQLDKQRQGVLSDIEYLRGNVETAESLKKSASSAGSASEDGGGDYGDFNTDFEVNDKQKDDLVQLISIMNPDLGEVVSGYDSDELLAIAKKLGIDVSSSILSSGTGIKTDSGVVTDDFLNETKPEDYLEYITKQYRNKK